MDAYDNDVREPSILPPLPTGEEMEAARLEREAQNTSLPSLGNGENVPSFLSGDRWLNTEIRDDEWLDFTEAYTRPNFLLSFRGRPFARMGDVQVISGQAGHGKSMLICQLITAVLFGEFGELRYELANINPNPKVLLIDTEQSKVDCIASKNRIMSICGWDIQEERPGFRVLMLRTTETAIERWRKTLKAIFEVQPNVIILDGLLDVIEDFNEPTGCAELIYKCMQTATHYEAAMICVLHQNPLSTKLVGHLGSAAMRKVTDILQVTKDKNANDITFKVTQTKARGHQDIEDWSFRVLPISWGIPEQIGSIPASNVEIEDIEKWLREGQDDVEWPVFETAIKDIFKKRSGIGSNDIIQECVTRAKHRNFLREQPKEEREKGQRYPKYYLSI